MPERKFTRRSLLAGATVTGLVGAIGGGTAALLSEKGTLGVLSDAVSLGNSLSNGSLDLHVEWNVAGGGKGSSEGAAPLPIDVTEENQAGSATFVLSLPGDANTPVYVWLRTTCPEPIQPADGLEVSLENGNGNTLLGSRPLDEFATSLRNGVPLDPNRPTILMPGDQGCLHTDEKLELRFDWALAEDFSGEASTSLAFEFVGRQCRHGDGTVNPFPSVGQCGAASNSIDGTGDSA